MVIGKVADGSGPAKEEPPKMALQWTPIRRRDGAVARARQTVQTLERQTQKEVLLAFKLSMVSAKGVTQVARPNLRTTYRKMADVGVQVDTDGVSRDSEFVSGNSFLYSSSTVAEINTAAEIMEPPRTPPHHHPLSLQNSTSSAGSSRGEEGEGDRKRPKSKNAELDMDAICVQQCESELPAEDDDTAKLTKPPSPDQPDGFVIVEEKPETSCVIDCLACTMQCCECTIL